AFYFSPVSAVRIAIAVAQSLRPPTPADRPALRPVPVPAAVAPAALKPSMLDARLSPTNLARLSSSKFGVPYGHDGAVHPRYFDCQTYVEHVMAMAMAPSAEQFEATLDRLRYRNGVVR